MRCLILGSPSACLYLVLHLLLRHAHAVHEGALLVDEVGRGDEDGQDHDRLDHLIGERVDRAGRSPADPRRQAGRRRRAASAGRNRRRPPPRRTRRSSWPARRSRACRTCASAPSSATAWRIRLEARQGEARPPLEEDAQQREAEDHAHHRHQDQRQLAQDPDLAKFCAPSGSDADSRRHCPAGGTSIVPSRDIAHVPVLPISTSSCRQHHGVARLLRDGDIALRRASTQAALAHSCPLFGLSIVPPWLRTPSRPSMKSPMALAKVVGRIVAHRRHQDGEAQHEVERLGDEEDLDGGRHARRKRRAPR